MALPIVKALLLCDYVILDRDTGKNSFIGVFHRIPVRQVPAQHPPIWIVAEVTELEGKHDFEFLILNNSAEDGPTPVARGEIRGIPFPSRRENYTIRFQTGPVPLPNEGTYDVQFSCDGTLIESQSFDVRKVTMPTPNAGGPTLPQLGAHMPSSIAFGPVTLRRRTTKRDSKRKDDKAASGNGSKTADSKRDGSGTDESPTPGRHDIDKGDGKNGKNGNGGSGGSAIAKPPDDTAATLPDNAPSDPAAADANAPREPAADASADARAIRATGGDGNADASAPRESGERSGDREARPDSAESAGSADVPADDRTGSAPGESSDATSAD